MHYSFYIVLIFLTEAFNLNAQQFSKQNVTIIAGDELKYNAADGGLTSPLFYTFDINGDNTPELIIYDKTGEKFIVYKLNVSSNQYKLWLNPPILFPRISNWAIVRDYNNDGIADLFTYPDTGPGGFQVWKGRKENGLTFFDLLQLHQGEFNILYFPSPNSGKLNIYVSSADQADLTDIDHDGDLDIFTFNPDGNYLEFYQNQSVEKGYSSDSLIFTRIDRCYGKFIESGLTNEILLSSDPNTCANNIQNPEIELRHSGSTTLVYDVDRDGIQDLIIGDISFEETKFLKNTGTNIKGFITEVDNDFPPGPKPMRLGPFPAIAALTLFNEKGEYLIFSNNTGKLTNEAKMNWLYKHEPDNTFKLIDTNFLRTHTVDLGIGFHPAIVDINGDGRLDIVAGNDLYNQAGNYTSGLSYFENQSTADEFKFTLIDDDFLGLKKLGSSNYAYQPSFGDLDNDGFIDLLIGNIQGYVAHYESTTKAPQALNFVLDNDHYEGIKVPSRSSPAMIDFDKDGDMDILIGDRNGQFALFVNTGTASNPIFQSKFNEEPNRYPFGNLNVKGGAELEGNATAAFVTIQGQQYLLSGSMSGQTGIYGPITSDPDNQLSPYNCCPGDEFDGRGSHPILADLNGDGWLDLIKGNIRGGFNLYSSNINTNGTIRNYAAENPTPIAQIYPTLLGQDESLHLICLSDISTIAIYALTGEKVFSKAKPSEKHIELKPKLNAGIYLVVITDETGKQMIKKILVTDVIN